MQDLPNRFSFVAKWRQRCGAEAQQTLGRSYSGALRLALLRSRICPVRFLIRLFDQYRSSVWVLRKRNAWDDSVPWPARLVDAALYGRNRRLSVTSVTKLSVGASDELFIERRERPASVALVVHDRSCIYLCGALRVVIIGRRGLRPTFAHPLNKMATRVLRFAFLCASHSGRHNTRSSCANWGDESLCDCAASGAIRPARNAVSAGPNPSTSQQWCSRPQWQLLLSGGGRSKRQRTKPE